MKSILLGIATLALTLPLWTSSQKQAATSKGNEASKTEQSTRTANQATETNGKTCDYLLKGTIGTYPVVMELNGQNDDLIGTYYYTSQGPKKRLRVELRYKGSGKWEMKEYVNGNYNGSFTIGIPTFKVGNTWTGTYTNVQKKSYKYSLTMSKIASGLVKHETGKVGNNGIVVEYYNCSCTMDSAPFCVGNYYYTSQGPEKRLALEWVDVCMSKNYYYDYVDGKQVGQFIYSTGYDIPRWTYTNAKGKNFRVTFDN